MDSAESFARNLNDARLPSRPGESSSAKPKTTQTATIRQETTRRTATTQESHSKPEFDFAVPGQTKRRSDDSPHRHSAYSSRQNLNDARLSSRPGESSSAKPKTTQITTNRQETTRRTATQESHSKLEFDFAVPGQSKRRSDESPHRHSDYSRESRSPSRKRSRHSGNPSEEDDSYQNRQQRDEQQDEEDNFRPASLELLLKYITSKFPAAYMSRQGSDSPPRNRRSAHSPQRFSDYSSRQGSRNPPRKSSQGSDTPPLNWLRLWHDSSADEAQTSSRRQHRNDQQGDEEYFRHASLALRWTTS